MQALPSGKLGPAISYTLGLGPRLTRFLEYPELDLSNNLAENSMRPVALGRKNWIHVGSAPSRTQRRGDPLGSRKLPAPPFPPLLAERLRCFRIFTQCALARTFFTARYRILSQSAFVARVIRLQEEGLRFFDTQDRLQPEQVVWKVFRYLSKICG